MTPAEEEELLAQPTPQDPWAQHAAQEGYGTAGLRPQQRDVEAFINQPSEPPPQERGFDWGRALTAWGGGDVGAYDAARARREDAPARQLKLRADQAEFDDAQKQRQLAQQMLDPSSPTSKAEQATFADYVNGLSMTPGFGADLQNEFKSIASRVPGMSASAISRLKPYTDQLAALHLKAIGTKAQSDLAAINMDLKKQMAGAAQTQEQQKNALDWFEAKEGQRHHKVMEDIAANPPKKPIGLRLFADQQKVVGEMANDLNQIRNLESLIPEAGKYAKETTSQIPGMGKSGILSGPVQTVKGMINPTQNPEYDKFRGNVQRLFSVERKVFAGVSVTPEEFAVLAPMIPDFNKDSEARIHSKLEAARDWLKTKTDTNMSRLQFDAEGNPIDRSLLAQMLRQKAPEATKNNPALREAAGLPTKSTQATVQTAHSPEDDAIAEQAKAKISDPAASPKAKAGAMKWLKDHGYGQ